MFRFLCTFLMIGVFSVFGVSAVPDCYEDEFITSRGKNGLLCCNDSNPKGVMINDINSILAAGNKIFGTDQYLIHASIFECPEGQYRYCEPGVIDDSWSDCKDGKFWNPYEEHFTSIKPSSNYIMTKDVVINTSNWELKCNEGYGWNKERSDCVKADYFSEKLEEVQQAYKERPRDIETKNSEGETPLIIATYGDRREILKYLLDKRANMNIDTKNHIGLTPLMLAANFGYTETVKLLLDAGADKNIKSNAGSTALYFATTKGHTEIIALLGGTAAPKTEPETEAKEDGNSEDSVSAATATIGTDCVPQYATSGKYIKSGSGVTCAATACATGRYLVKNSKKWSMGWCAACPTGATCAGGEADFACPAGQSPRYEDNAANNGCGPEAIQTDGLSEAEKLAIEQFKAEVEKAKQAFIAETDKIIELQKAVK